MDSEPYIRNNGLGESTTVFLIQCLEAIGTSFLRLLYGYPEAEPLSGEEAGQVAGAASTGDAASMSEAGPAAAPNNGAQARNDDSNYLGESTGNSLWTPRDIKPAEWIMIVFTAVTAMAAWAGVWMSHGQLAEMEGGSADTHNLVIATQRLATAAHFQADETKRLKDAAEQQAVATKRLADLSAMQTQMTGMGVSVAIDQAKTAMNSSAATERLAKSSGEQVDALFASERPWAGTTIPVSSPPAAGSDWRFTIPLVNTGRGPALRVKVNVFNGFMDDLASEKIIDPFHCGVNDCQSITLLPGAVLQIPKTVPKEVMTTDNVNHILNRSRIYAVISGVSYYDARNHVHHTSSCAIYTREIGFTSCIGGNDAD